MDTIPVVGNGTAAGGGTSNSGKGLHSYFPCGGPLTKIGMGVGQVSEWFWGPGVGVFMYLSITLQLIRGVASIISLLNTPEHMILPRVAAKRGVSPHDTAYKSVLPLDK